MTTTPTDLMQPFATLLDMNAGLITPSGPPMQRHLSDMRGMYADAEAEAALLAEGDPLIYEVHGVAPVPMEVSQVPYCTTIIHPGRVGDEYYMTKGHYHAVRDRAELYIGLAGEGRLIMQTVEGEFRSLPMTPGTLAYIPGYWAHRTVNVGDEPFIFLSVWPGDAGHDYGTIETTGFVKLLVKQDGAPTFVDNPRWQV